VSLRGDDKASRGIWREILGTHSGGVLVLPKFG
jgi:hypothetical protein